MITGGVYAFRPEIDAWWTAHQTENRKAASLAGDQSDGWRTLVPVAAVALFLMSGAGWLCSAAILVLCPNWLRYHLWGSKDRPVWTERCLRLRASCKII